MNAFLFCFCFIFICLPVYLPVCLSVQLLGPVLFNIPFFILLLLAGWLAGCCVRPSMPVCLLASLLALCQRQSPSRALSLFLFLFLFLFLSHTLSLTLSCLLLRAAPISFLFGHVLFIERPRTLTLACVPISSPDFDSISMWPAPAAVPAGAEASPTDARSLPDCLAAPLNRRRAGACRSRRWLSCVSVRLSDRQTAGVRLTV
jgi:hypothetical protein